MSRNQAAKCKLPKSHTQLNATPPHTEDYLGLEFLDGISRHEKHLSREFLPVMKGIWPGDRNMVEDDGKCLRGSC